ncbi:MAG TPA: glycosyltransferase family 2 protein [Sumerlaeia bacterium]|nr:glycosyltransferase family 2 protein [Sumerlaeia bacterium]
MGETPAPEISIVVANWNGEGFLRTCLASLWESATAAGRAFEIVVVDDASEDNSVSLIREEFPRVRLLANERNLGYARTCDRGAQAARGRVLVMVNNDVEVPADFVSRLTAPFSPGASAAPEDPARTRPLFAVSAKTVDWADGSPNHLCMTAAWRRGGIGKEWADPAEPCEATYAQGGAAAYDRDLFLRLGGFDPLFSPGYWEDYDLSYRAARAGWRVLYEPRAVARHKGKSSLGPLLGEARLRQLDERNRLWFNWLNLDPDLLLCRHLLAIPWICARDLLAGNGITGLAGFFRAAAGVGRVLRARARRRLSDPPAARSHRELLTLYDSMLHGSQETSPGKQPS